MNYEKNYYDYTAYVKTLNRKKGNGVYYERHHIVPKCAGGKDTPENLVLLTAREHFLAHYLLTKIYKDTLYSYNLDYAFICMKRDGYKQQRYFNSWLYESIKVRFAKEVSENNKGQVAWNKGIPRTDSVKQAVSKANKGRTAWNKGKTLGAHSPESNRKRSETLKKGYANKQYVDRKGKIPWNKGKRKEVLHDHEGNSNSDL